MSDESSQTHPHTHIKSWRRKRSLKRADRLRYVVALDSQHNVYITSTRSFFHTQHANSDPYTVFANPIPPPRCRQTRLCNNKPHTHRDLRPGDTCARLRRGRLARAGRHELSVGIGRTVGAGRSLACHGENAQMGYVADGREGLPSEPKGPDRTEVFKLGQLARREALADDGHVLPLSGSRVRGERDGDGGKRGRLVDA